MKKILIYSIFFYPSIGGVQSTSRILANALVHLGYNVTVFTNSPLNNHHELTEEYIVIRSTNWIRLAYLCSKHDLLIVKAGVSVVAGLTAWLTRTSYIFYHEMIGSYYYSHHSWKGFFSNFLRNFLADKAGFHVGVTRSCLISKQINPNIPQFVIYNCVSQELQIFSESEKYRNQEKIYDVLFVGRLIKAKGIYVLADAVKIFEEKKIPLTVCLVGAGEDLQLQAYLSGCSTVKVDFPGLLQGEMLAKAYASSRLLVIPSIHPEGMGLVIAEAFMFNIPALGSNQPAIEEIIDHKYLIFENASAKDLFNNLMNILFDPEIYKLCQNHASKQRHKFLYSKYVAKIKFCLDFVFTY